MTVPVSLGTIATPDRSGPGARGRSRRAALRRPATIASILVLAVTAILVVFAPLITRALGVDPYSFNTDRLGSIGSLPTGWLNSGIGWEHPLGVEPQTGRDILARLLYGARVSLAIAVAATALTVTLGIVAGMVAGYSGGRVDRVLSRCMDLVLAFPLLLILVALSGVLTQRLVSLGLEGNAARGVYIVAVLSFFGWPYVARMVRGQVLSLRESGFVLAARSLGAGTPRILTHDVLPHLWPPVIVYATALLPSFIAAEAALSFLGVGVLPPTPTWGAMLADSVRFFTVVPTYLFIPGTALFVVVLAFNLLGDALRDVLDPRGRV